LEQQLHPSIGQTDRQTDRQTVERYHVWNNGGSQVEKNNNPPTLKPRKELAICHDLS